MYLNDTYLTILTRYRYYNDVYGSDHLAILKNTYLKIKNKHYKKYNNLCVNKP